MNETLRMRSNILDFLRKEIVGPAPGYPAIQIDSDHQEILREQDSPRQRYSAGVLFPQRSRVHRQSETHDDELVPVDADSPEQAPDKTIKDLVFEANTTDTEDEQSQTDRDVSMANEFLPSAMGLSTLVRVPDVLEVRVEAGVYERREMTWSSRREKNNGEYTQKGWWRSQIEQIVDVKSDELLGSNTQVVNRTVYEEEGCVALELHVVSRILPDFSPKERQRLVTITLINRKRSENKTPSSEDCFYQCGFSVKAGSDEPCFSYYPEHSINCKNLNELSLQLLHLHRRSFAVGHGCAADWEDTQGNMAKVVRTEVMPTYETKPVLPTKLEGLNLCMKRLREGNKESSIRLCALLRDKYAEWIQQKEQDLSAIDDLSLELRQTAMRHLENCRLCLKRIDDGIAILTKDHNVYRAFALMNEAMLMQQVHYKISSENRREWILNQNELKLERPFERPSYESDHEWRPFQLAFILINLRSLAVPSSLDREIVDLIWFPTGGGKTEAYLGLSTISMFLRRLRNAECAGTTVLMRYTLRLLTTQQFQRAASLICACEVLRRRDNETLGDERFSIGLWVGGDVTPNRETDAIRALQSLLRGQSTNKFILRSCPWCGAAMGSLKVGRRFDCKGYKQLSHPTRVRHVCEEPNCEFNSDSGLPISVIDEHIYNEPPTLLIGTVDKFAMLAFRPEARKLFGIDIQCPPPELIIQDELHLISGPLGSMVGHYETAIDALCYRESDGIRIGPKIVASTATISHAENQVKSLYGRDVFLFPPQAIRLGDSFFAEERDDEMGRLYVGVFATALSSHVRSQVITMSALLQAPNLFGEQHAEVVDPYWTLVGYFNSLRELGHAATLIRADIREHLNAMWNRLGLQVEQVRKLSKDPRRWLRSSVELTSRVQSEEIPSILQKLFVSYDGTQSSEVVDVCFATNMIQVGVDIPRLSLMTIVGQPKTTSEYIQASSRIGRLLERPGIVITNYNPSKPRDRSHYENFRSYHQCIYRYVEPTSVTAFAAPVRERALHALVVILCRFWGDQELRERPTQCPDEKLVRRVKDCIKHRVKIVDPAEWSFVENEIDEFIEVWSNTLPSRYGDFGQFDSTLPLMYPAGGQQHEEWNNWPYATPTSMRSVDSECSARQLLYGYGVNSFKESY
ncbi:MAG: hypothetical protein F4W92_03900 [Gammaproteobacteria bacterium]|nr:hypothetical protein [Gammaproteobacteria bacterium]